jgi:chromosome segregation ATPase
VLDRLSVPPRLALRALDDLNTVAAALRELAAREGDLSSVARSLTELPKVEDELSAQIESLKVEVRSLHEWLEPLHRELTDLDETAEALEHGLARVNESILGLHTLLKKLPGV